MSVSSVSQLIIQVTKRREGKSYPADDGWRNLFRVLSNPLASSRSASRGAQHAIAVKKPSATMATKPCPHWCRQDCACLVGSLHQHGLRHACLGLLRLHSGAANTNTPNTTINYRICLLSLSFLLQLPNGGCFCSGYRSVPVRLRSARSRSECAGLFHFGGTYLPYLQQQVGRLGWSESRIE